MDYAFDCISRITRNTLSVKHFFLQRTELCPLNGDNSLYHGPLIIPFGGLIACFELCIWEINYSPPTLIHSAYLFH